MLTQERLKELYDYDPDTGIFTYKVIRRGSGYRPGDVAGCDDGRGYVQFTIDKKRVRGHRLAFLYMTGRYPLAVDHINGIRSDNRWSNLREANQSQNMMNRGLQSNNTSGEKGVYWSERDRLWSAEAVINGKKYVLYSGKSRVKAVDAARNFRKANHGEFYRER